MNDSELRDIFSRFQNLNLLNLRGNLRSGRIHRGGYWSVHTLNLCPIAHGWTGGVMWGQGRIFGVVPNELASRFVEWFDDQTLGNYDGIVRRLLQIVESIWRERLADAVALQSVIQGVYHTDEAKADCMASMN